MSAPLNIITGMLLGDACLVLASHNALLKLQHGLRQEDYLLHKAKLLEELTSVNIRRIEDNGHGYPTIVAETKSHPFYTKLHDKWYRNGRKQITLDAIQGLDDVGLAYWFMDDGSLTVHHQTLKDGTKSPSGREFHLHTQSYTLEENELLRDYVEFRFGIKMRVSKHKRIYWVLGCGATEGQKLLSTIRSYVLPVFNYKMNMQYVDKFH